MNKTSFIIFFAILIFIIINEIKYSKNIEKIDEDTIKNIKAYENLEQFITKVIKEYHPKKDWNDDDFEDFILSGYKPHKYDFLLIKDNLEVQGQLYNHGDTIIKGNVVVDGGINMPIIRLESKSWKLTNANYILHIPITDNISLLKYLKQNSTTKRINELESIYGHQSQGNIENLLLKISYSRNTINRKVCKSTTEAFMSDSVVMDDGVESQSLEKQSKCKWYELFGCEVKTTTYAEVEEPAPIIMLLPPTKEWKICEENKESIRMMETENNVYFNDSNILLLFDGIVININKDMEIDGIHLWSTLFRYSAKNRNMPEVDEIDSLDKIDTGKIKSTEINNTGKNKIFNNTSITKYKKYIIPTFDKIRVYFNSNENFVFNNRKNIDLKLFTLYDKNNKIYKIYSIYFSNQISKKSQINLFIITKFDSKINEYYLEYDSTKKLTEDKKLIKYTTDSNIKKALERFIIRISPQTVFNISNYNNVY